MVIAGIIAYLIILRLKTARRRSCLDTETADNMRDLFEKAVETLATGTGHIQQRLADAYVRSHLGEEANLNPDLPADVYALQRDLQAAMSTAHDSERGAAGASAGSLTDDQATILA